MRRAAIFLLLAACGTDEPLASEQQPLMAFCQADVTGVGLLEVETDYLPHVIACENGSAGTEALKAQAVAARSYLYYKLEHSGSIGDGQGDQVYTCARAPGPEHMQAAADTAGQVLRYQNTQVAAFFVAGAKNQPAPTCRGSTDDPTNTEKYVTYNEGLAGDQITQTTLGFVDPTNYANRGCMSQNGSDCLSDSGHAYDDILRFYYGADIELVTADGPCVAAVPDGGPVGADAGGTGADDPAGACACRAGGSGTHERGAPRRGAAALVLVLLVAGYARRFRADAP
jgi:hypothetical protein